jgi:hypothetical protein
MGYYVTLMDSDVSIPASKLDEAYQAILKLNERDDLKSGGRWPGHDCPRPEGLDFHPNRWFSWMPADLTECGSLRGVLEHLGFDCDEFHGDLSLISYDSKTGQEDLFLETLAPFISDGCMQWRGEDGFLFRWVFENGVMRQQEGRIQWVD